MSMVQEAQTLTSATPQVLLGNHLKALKLPTFARTAGRLPSATPSA